MTTITAVLDAITQALRPALEATAPGTQLVAGHPAPADATAWLQLIRISAVEGSHSPPSPRPGRSGTPDLTVSADVLLAFQGSSAGELLATALTVVHRQPVLRVDVETLRLVPVDLSLDELDSLWSMLGRPHCPALLLRVGPFALHAHTG